MLNRIRQWFCRHNWQVSKYQALNSYGVSYICSKCGKYRHDD